MAVLLTFVISSYLYVDYSVKLWKNVILNGQFRNEIASKIHPRDRLAQGMTAENLTLKEYQEIASIKRFPKLPAEATNISYNYQNDDFLPDYSFSLIYYVPREMKIDTINFKTRNFSKYQRFELIGDKKQVAYSEYAQ